MDSTTVTHIAKLSQIAVPDADKPQLASELSSIMRWIEMLQSVDTTGVEPLASVAHHTLPMREDTVTDGDKVEAILRNAPHSEHACFAVPKVIDQG
jgi:aspartyl-tRNA(Asn)/glutamyl-tRNA(Gln) amidotransferase subunit C